MTANDWTQFEHLERWQAMHLTAALIGALGAEKAPDTDIENGRPAYQAPAGDRVVCLPRDGRVILSGETYRLDLTITPTRTAVAFQGDLGGEATLGIIMADSLREAGDLPGDAGRLSALQIADLADLRERLAAD